jgi:glycosyltransferase 2 family protein
MTDPEQVPGLLPEVEDLLAEGRDEPPPAAASSRRRTLLRVGGLVLTVAALVFVVLEMISVWPDLVEVARDADWRWLVVSALVFLVAELAFALSWPACLRLLDHPIDRREGAAAFLVTQTAKFVPGSVWQAVGRFGAAERLGLPRRVTGASLLIETAGLVGAALVIGGATGAVGDTLEDAWEVSSGLATLASAGAVAVGLVGVVVGGVLARRLFDGTTPKPVVVLAFWQAGVWLGWGLGAAALAVAVDVPAGAVVGAFAFSWVCGFVVIGAPAGLGVREVVMSAALAPTMAEADALAVTIGSRAIWTVVQLGCAAAGAGLLARHGWRLRSLASSSGAPEAEADGETSAVAAPALGGAVG